VIIIGVDPHKRMHVASVVESVTNRQVATVEIAASLAGYRRLLRWADTFTDRVGRWRTLEAWGVTWRSGC
jgi:transposase